MCSRGLAFDAEVDRVRLHHEQRTLARPDDSCAGLRYSLVVGPDDELALISTLRAKNRARITPINNTAMPATTFGR